MRIDAVYSHLNGLEWLQVRRRGYWKEIKECIQSVNAKECRTKASKESRKVDKIVYSPTQLNKQFKKHFNEHHWSRSRVNQWVTAETDLSKRVIDLPADRQKEAILQAGHEALPSYKEIDFVKNRVAVEVQFGKYSFIAHDLYVKHLAFFTSGEIDCGVEILPMKAMQRDMSSGPPYYEGALHDLLRQGRGVPAVPLIVVGVAE